MEKCYSDYTGISWPWPRKRTPSVELVSIFKDQATLEGRIPAEGKSDRKNKAKHYKPAHVAEPT